MARRGRSRRATEQAGADQPAAEQAGTDQPAAEQPGADRAPDPPAAEPPEAIADEFRAHLAALDDSVDGLADRLEALARRGSESTSSYLAGLAEDVASLRAEQGLALHAQQESLEQLAGTVQSVLRDLAAAIDTGLGGLAARVGALAGQSTTGPAPSSADRSDDVVAALGALGERLDAVLDRLEAPRRTHQSSWEQVVEAVVRQDVIDPVAPADPVAPPAQLPPAAPAAGEPAALELAEALEQPAGPEESTPTAPRRRRPAKAPAVRSKPRESAPDITPSRSDASTPPPPGTVVKSPPRRVARSTAGNPRPSTQQPRRRPQVIEPDSRDTD